MTSRKVHKAPVPLDRAILETFIFEEKGVNNCSVDLFYLIVRSAFKDRWVNLFIFVHTLLGLAESLAYK